MALARQLLDGTQNTMQCAWKNSDQHSLVCSNLHVYICMTYSVIHRKKQYNAVSLTAKYDFIHSLVFSRLTVHIFVPQPIPLFGVLEYKGDI